MTDNVFPLDPFALLAETQKRFGIGQEEARRATEALMPAFWAGLRRNAAAPNGYESLLRAFTPPIFQQATSGGMAQMPGMPWLGGNWPKDAWPTDWTGGRSPTNPVEAFLQFVFPNEAIRRAVLDQVAATTGIRHDALNSMMPVVATLMMGQIARNFAVGPARDMLDAFMAGYARGRPQPAPTPADMMAPFAEAMSAFLSGFTRAGERRTEAPAPEHEDEEEAAPPEEEPEEAPEATAAASGAAPGAMSGAGLFDEFLAAGRSMQESQIRAFEQLFETLAPGEQAR